MIKEHKLTVLDTGTRSFALSDSCAVEAKIDRVPISFHLFIPSDLILREVKIFTVL